MILQQSLHFFILWHWPTLVKFFNDYLLELALTHAHSHLLVKLAKLLDFAPLKGLVAEYHHTSGPGTAITHPAAKLVRLMLVKYLYDLSLRETEERLYSDTLVRWFVGYSLFEPLPDHTTIQRFEVWLNEAQHFAIFDEIVRQIKRDFPAETRATQIGDTYAMKANAAQEELRPMLRHICARLLAAALEAFPNQVEAALRGFAWEQLLGSPPEPGLPSKEEQAERLQRVVLAALELQQRVTPLLSGCAKQECPVLRQLLAALSKILADEVVVEGQTVRRLAPKEQGSFRIGSATDVEASYRKHGPDPEDTSFGYNVQVAVSKGGFIHETQAYTGAVPDQAGVATLVETQVERRGACPPKLIYDQAAGAGKTRAEVEKVSQRRTQLVAKLPDYEKDDGRFGPYNFALSEDGKSLTCPNQQVSQVAYPAGAGEGRTFRFLHFQCWPGEGKKDPACRCPFWEQCRQAGQGPRAMRQVFVSKYRAQVLAAQEYNATETFRYEMKLRPRVERIIFELTNYNGARQARRRGVDNADWQAKMCATAYNLKHWVRKTDLRNARQMAARG